MTNKKNSFSDSILKKIQSEEIKQRPAWHFWMKNAFWIIFALSAFIGGRAIGVIAMVLSETDLPFFMEAHGPFMHHITNILPFFWILFFLLFLLLANYGLHHTKKGYKLSMAKLISINLITSIIIGGGAFLLNDGERFEELVHKNAPVFRKLEDNRRQIWSNPDEGRIAGTILIIENESILILDDFNKSTWVINYSDAKMRRSFDLRTGIKISIIGENTSQTQNTLTFTANKISPWHKKPR